MERRGRLGLKQRLAERGVGVRVGRHVEVQTFNVHVRHELPLARAARRTPSRAGSRTAAVPRGVDANIRPQAHRARARAGRSVEFGYFGR